MQEDDMEVQEEAVYPSIDFFFFYFFYELI